jgi:hypothetical protein
MIVLGITKIVNCAKGSEICNWPFCGGALDFVGQIYPSSSKGHRLVLVATDDFTK